MADVKWIKIVTDIFDNRKIRQIESMPEGDSIIVVWMKLLCLAGVINDNGLVYFTTDIPYTDQLLANQFNRPISTIQLALRTFESFGMIEIVDDVICVSNWEKYQNTEGMERIKEQTRIRVAKHREKKKLECNVTGNVTVTQCNAPDIDIDKDIDKDNNTPLTPLGEWDAEKHTNVQNYDHLVETEMNEVKNTQLLNTVREWLAYKDGRKPKASNHYQLQSIRTLTNKVFENAKAYGTDAVIAVINESMANNYSGITWNELLKRGNPKQSNRYSFMDD